MYELETHGQHTISGSTASQPDGIFISAPQIHVWNKILQKLGEEGWAVAAVSSLASSDGNVDETLWIFRRQTS